MDASASLAAIGPGHRSHHRRAGTAVLGLLVTGALLLAGAIALVPALAGARALTVLSASMDPALPAGSVAVVRPVAPASIRPGDIITFVDRDAAGQPTVTHRVVAVHDTPAGPAFTTRGDANGAADPGRTPAADVRGALWYHLPWVGTMRELLIGPAAMFYLAGALLILVAAHLLAPGGGRSRGGRR